MKRMKATPQMNGFGPKITKKSREHWTIHSPQGHHDVRRPAPDENDHDGDGKPECPLPGSLDMSQIVAP